MLEVFLALHDVCEKRSVRLSVGNCVVIRHRSPSIRRQRSRNRHSASLSYHMQYLL